MASADQRDNTFQIFRCAHILGRKRFAFDMLDYYQAFFCMNNLGGQSCGMGSAAGGKFVEAHDVVLGYIHANAHDIFGHIILNDKVEVRATAPKGRDVWRSLPQGQGGYSRHRLPVHAFTRKFAGSYNGLRWTAHFTRSVATSNS